MKLFIALLVGFLTLSGIAEAKGGRSFGGARSAPAKASPARTAAPAAAVPQQETEKTVGKTVVQRTLVITRPQSPSPAPSGGGVVSTIMSVAGGVVLGNAITSMFTSDKEPPAVAQPAPAAAPEQGVK